MTRFTHFAAIDWSGAAGERHRGIAVAICTTGRDAPQLVRPGHRWSRAEVLDWLATQMPEGTLAGLDLGMSLPFADRGAFFPGWNESPDDARALWALIDRICAGDAHLCASSFVGHEWAHRFFRHRGEEGDLFGGGRGRFRITEHAQREAGCNPYSNFNLVGAAQVGKSSLTGMRVLHRLSGLVPVWPVDALPGRGGSAVVEIYTSLAAIHAGRRAGQTKLRSYEELNEALAALGSGPVPAIGPVDDHISDALITAAWLREVAHLPEYWHPSAMTDEIAQTEGWTFGAL
ncbi:hypothetical protein SZ64_18035 [Erythrobacter sp. SG61-1L]|uniref:hypothetical protein n=1 Tax=Erythrobacter sp. SG61-1L TaxID=1603897 RepID=UPI0006C9095E|nr:hypothetical protein [Erythrobacter sp. SG61-1L]KPL69715.1 hypothetical protein SZ64_17410 [Erythrobacter sp. SG61-1L]KPL69832.1 hypothetical protein SZ64_18035 [Erythrobacter sp. SG61-1L]